MESSSCMVLETLHRRSLFSLTGSGKPDTACWFRFFQDMGGLWKHLEGREQASGLPRRRMRTST